MPDPNNPASYGMTDEQMAALLQMEDLGGMERKMAQQNALSNTLRGQALQPSAGRDWASQLARGLQGGMAGYAMKQAGTGIDQYGAAKKANLGKAMEFLRKKPPMAPTMAPGAAQQPLTQEDLTGF